MQVVSSRDIPLHLAYYEYLRADDRDFGGKLGKAQRLQALIDSRVRADKFFMALAREVGAGDAETLFHSQPLKLRCEDCCPQVCATCRLQTRS
jgi:hypothetical protein